MSLAIVRAVGLCSFQDLGRPGHMHDAVPPGGAMVPELLVAANRAAGNADDAPAIEVCGQLVVVPGLARRPTIAATDTFAARTLVPGEEVTIASGPRRVTYLALRGGVAAPLVLGGRGTLLCAGLGELLHAGAVISAFGDDDAMLAAGSPVAPRAFDDAGPIRVVAGPDPDAFEAGALDLLLAGDYRILPTSDRVGTRLEGAAIPRSDAPPRSRPMVTGAIEVPADGQPIVLGPENPTCGGYPLIAVIAHTDLGRFFARPLGATVRFERAA